MDRNAVVEIVGRFRRSLEARGIRPQKVILYGSHATGVPTAVSDIDVREPFPLAEGARGRRFDVLAVPPSLRPAAQDEKFRDAEEESLGGDGIEPVLPEEIEKRPPVRERCKAIRDVPVDLVVPVEDEPPESAPRPEQQPLGDPEAGRLRLREIEEGRRPPRPHDPTDLEKGPRRSGALRSA